MPTSLSTFSLTPAELHYVLLNGHSVVRQNREYIVLDETDIPAEDRHNRHWRRLIGTVVVTSVGGQLLEVYKARTLPLRRGRQNPKRSPTMRTVGLASGFAF